MLSLVWLVLRTLAALATGVAKKKNHRMIPKTHLVSSKPWEQKQEIGKEREGKNLPREFDRSHQFDRPGPWPMVFGWVGCRVEKLKKKRNIFPILAGPEAVAGISTCALSHMRIESGCQKWRDCHQQETQVPMLHSREKPEVSMP